ncbi:helix-turn-helix domain-containing protein [Brevibacterium ravenspurgense]|uniref:IclR family transcriptional regulator n=1 Tax=Brevibacterium ravenspurgense TaxID=479117 RepID=UPI001EF38298|nr:helix-turn-helix domain-containing protein [Brevibacterium ravenspurgense]MCG7300561.1 helix-turn-helix domain-containing protein [Brevibacterium ravenspurgense]
MANSEQPSEKHSSELVPGGAKTLHNGLLVLKAVVDSGVPVTVSEIAARVGIHRTVVHRLVKTLEGHSLVVSSATSRYSPGWGLVGLAGSYQADVRASAQPIMEELAERAGATCNLVVQVDSNSVVALQVVEPVSARAHVAFSSGYRHSLNQGSAGIAILAARPPLEGERKEIKEARLRGFAVTKSEIIPNVVGISAPISIPSTGATYSIGVSVFDDSELERYGALVIDAAKRLKAVLSSIG